MRLVHIWLGCARCPPVCRAAARADPAANECESWPSGVVTSVVFCGLLFTSPLMAHHGPISAGVFFFFSFRFGSFHFAWNQTLILLGGGTPKAWKLTAWQ